MGISWELMSYVATVIGLPLAITVYLFEQPMRHRQAPDRVLRTVTCREGTRPHRQTADAFALQCLCHWWPG